jgi:Carboxypeptidase regulatory-like domain
MRAALIGLVIVALVITGLTMFLHDPGDTRPGRNAREETESVTPPDAPDPRPVIPRLRGRVLAEDDGRLLSGITVEARLEGAEPVRCVSDANGAYVLGGLPAGTALVFARGQGFVSRGEGVGEARGLDAVRVEIPEKGVVERDLIMRTEGRLAGRVLEEDETPAVGFRIATVRAEPLHRRCPTVDLLGELRPEHAEAVTDADGRFSIGGLVTGSLVRLLVWQDGFLRLETGRFLVLRERTDEVVIRLSGARRLEVRVTAKGKGTPLAGAEVRVLRGAGRGRRSTTSGPWKTNGEGRLVLGLPSSRDVSLLVEHPDCVRNGRLWKVPVDTRSVSVELEAGLSISGRVVLPPGVTATMVFVSARGETVQPDLPDGYLSVGRESEPTPDSAFALRGLRPGRYAVAAHAYARTGVYDAKVVTEAGREDLVLEVNLREASSTPVLPEETLVARVLDFNGSPILSCRARLWTLDPRTGPNVTTNAHMVDNEGTLHIQLPPVDRVKGDRWLVIHSATDARGAPRPLALTVHGPIAADSREETVVLRPERTITGVVRDAEGRPVPGTIMEATGHARELGMSGQPVALPGVARAISGGDGSFRLGRLRDGEYSLDVVPPDGFQRPAPTLVTAGTSDVTITLAAGVGLMVTILDDEGRPVPDATVSAGGQFATTDSAGRAWLMGLDASRTYRLAARDEDPGHGSVVTKDWRPEPVTLTLPRVWFVRGVVRSPGGAPRPHAKLQWRRADEERWREFEARGTNAGFLIEGLGEGEIVIHAASMYGSLTDPDLPETRVATGTDGVLVTLEAGQTLEVPIAGVPRRTRCEVRAIVMRNGRRHVRLTYIFLGACRLDGLRDGDRVTLWARVVDGDECWLGRDLTPGGPIPRARLAPGRTVIGRILCPEGIRAGFARFDEFDRVIRVDAEGRFEVRGVPPGEWHIRAKIWIAGVPRERTVPIPASGEMAIDLRKE